jgi:dipeptidyl aminopeptidase/acylaminoacyl peptidase
VLVTSLLLLTACAHKADLTDPAAPLDKAAIHYTSDGLTITGLISKPPGPGPFPLILLNHGGFAPARSMSPYMDLFTKLGYVSLASDYRGCGNSQGKHEVARGEVRDVIAAMDYAATLPYVDASRIVHFGISHGGANALLAASRDGRIKAIVDVVGPVELADCYPYWVKNQNKPGIKPLVGLTTVIGGTPSEAPDKWRERSALYVADQIHCPVLLLYGDADDAIPADQGPRMFEALKQAGNTQCELMLLPGENHIFQKATWDRIGKHAVNFLNRRVKLPVLPEN